MSEGYRRRRWRSEDGVEARGATIEEAVGDALGQFGANREQVEVQVLSPESRALPGERLSTGERRVRVYRIDEHAANARALLEETAHTDGGALPGQR